ANARLTERGPTSPEPPADGPAQLSSSQQGQPSLAGSGSEGVSKPSPEKIVPTESSRPDQRLSELPKPEPGPDPSAQAHRLGIPGTLPPEWCPHWKAMVDVQGKGQCVRCKRFVKNSFAARKHPVNLLRRDQILKKLVADYQPTTTMLTSTCEH